MTSNWTSLSDNRVYKYVAGMYYTSKSEKGSFLYTQYYSNVVELGLDTSLSLFSALHTCFLKTKPPKHTSAALHAGWVILWSHALPTALGFQLSAPQLAKAESIHAVCRITKPMGRNKYFLEVLVLLYQQVI